jgi:hypothetical protein
MTMKSVPINRCTKAGLSLFAAALLAAEALSQSPDFYIFLAFGQSNMEGYPEVQAQDKTGVNARFRLLPAVDWPDKSRTKGTWSDAAPPLCRSGTGLCPCDYFGRTLTDSLPEKIKVGIVNVSVAGCAIDMFDKNNYQGYISGQQSWMKDIANQYGGNPYARLVEMGKAAQKDGVVKGILLHQGETDAGTAGWATKVKGVYDNLIKDLSLDTAATPLLAGDLLSSSSGVQNLPKTIRNCYVISSQGLKGRDQWHFTAEGYRELGKRYGVKMLELLRKRTAAVARGAATTEYALRVGADVKQGRAAIFFEISQRAFISLAAYAPNGKKVAGIAGADFAAGRHTVELGKAATAAGVLVVKMRSDAFSVTRTIVAAGR